MLADLSSLRDLIRTRKLRLAGLYGLCFLLINLYLLNRYRAGETSVDQIRLSSGLGRDRLLLYVTPERGEGLDLTAPVQARQEGQDLVFDLEGRKIRKFRLYAESGGDTTFMSEIRLLAGDRTIAYIPEQLRREGIHFTGRTEGDRSFFVSGDRAFFESRREVLTAAEWLMCEVLVCLLSALLCLLSWMVWPSAWERSFPRPDWPRWSVCAFLVSVFLPQPFFNILFMLSFLMLIRRFRPLEFFRNPAALGFVLYFAWFMINNLFVSDTFNRRFTETLLPFFFLPFYFACVPRSDYFRVFPLLAFFLSLWCASTSLLDAAVYRSAAYFSFDAFSKYIHPVYFSYLLFFSLCYLELRGMSQLSGPLLRTVLIAALICCGSKLVISLLAVFYVVRLFRRRVLWGLGALLVFVGAILLFGPTRKRFQDLAGVAKVSVLSEPQIRSDDPRLNGLTLRLLLWQESLRDGGDLKDIVMGKGVDQRADRILEDRLSERGLQVGHARYDPHNQFIATYYKLGLLGLTILLALCVFYYYQAFRYGDALMLWTAILFSAAMLTESVLQRVTGIYFFICILLLHSGLIISRRHFENSDTRNQGNSE